MDDHREDIIRARAKELWEQEGRPEGRDDEFWFRAAEEFDSGRLMEPEPSAYESGTHAEEAGYGRRDGF